ncbi:MAG: Rne/Rng family ribonuclease [Clostridia bacterium]|nr:Rne/Rng family ribonuclease [Clostridia bacterium]
MSELIVNKNGTEVNICILEDNVVCELYTLEAEQKNIMGNIYMGKVRNVVDGMQAAFIDIGKEKNAFISIKDALPKVDVVKEEQVIDSKISEVLKVGDNVLVQVKKAPTVDKGARVSTHITIPGNYVVFMPNTNIITISQKIESEDEKDRLVAIVKNNLPENCGAIVRTDADGINEERLISDIKHLVELWNNIKNKAKKCEETELLYNEHELVSKITRELINQKLTNIYVNDKEMYEELRQSLEKKNLLDTTAIELVNEDIIEKFGLGTQILEAAYRKIWLKCGGYIIIDKTEALTAIDVNSGKYIGNSNLEETALEVNEEAAKEIMRQIRLKDIGGIIIIDYIDLLKKENQEKIIQIMQEEVKKDRSKIDIKGYTELNLVELTRKMLNI